MMLRHWTNVICGKQVMVKVRYTWLNMHHLDLLKLTAICWTWLDSRHGRKVNIQAKYLIIILYIKNVLIMFKRAAEMPETWICLYM